MQQHLVITYAKSCSLNDRQEKMKIHVKRKSGGGGFLVVMASYDSMIALNNDNIVMGILKSLD